MSRVIVEYNPPLSIGAEEIIRHSIVPSMYSDTTCQYEIGQCLDALEEMVDDMTVLLHLSKDGVNFIEL